MRFAYIGGANMTGALYEPVDLPSILDISSANEQIDGGCKESSRPRSAMACFHRVWFAVSPQGLTILREKMLSIGNINGARRITLAINRSKMRKMGDIEAILVTVAFDWTTEWGYSPGRAILILLIGILVYWLLYLGMIWFGFGAIYKESPLNENNELTRKTDSIKLFTEKGKIKSLIYTLYYSIMSAFHIGWRDINLGAWLSRVQTTHFRVRGDLWIKTISGVQSVMSVFLLALWALTYFGSPFN